MKSISNTPQDLPSSRKGTTLGHGRIVNGKIHDGLWDLYGDVHMGNCGRNKQWIMVFCARHKILPWILQMSLLDISSSQRFLRTKFSGGKKKYPAGETVLAEANTPV